MLLHQLQASWSEGIAWAPSRLGPPPGRTIAGMTTLGCLPAPKVPEQLLCPGIFATVSRRTRSPRCPRHRPLQQGPPVVRDRWFVRSVSSLLLGLRVGSLSYTE